jgi:hypothetical protein
VAMTATAHVTAAMTAARQGTTSHRRRAKQGGCYDSNCPLPHVRSLDSSHAVLLAS